VDDPLAMKVETMRRLGYEAIDLLVDGIDRRRDGPVLRMATPRQMADRWPHDPGEQPGNPEVLLRSLIGEVLEYRARWDHPRNFGYIPGSGTWPAALGDLVASAWNVDTSAWREGAGPNTLELTVLDWFRMWIGYPAEASGILVTGGSAANLTALACAREAMLGAMDDRAVVYVSDQSHSSVAKAARVLGFRPDQVRVLPSDAAFRMRPDALEGAIRADLAAGRLPLFVSAAAGSTNTGAIDPLGELAEICQRRGAWLHVDGAYGGFAVLTERGKRLLQGIELADSVALDPHKWLFQPYECGCVLVREGERLSRAFEILPDYLRDTEHDPDEVNFADRGLQLSRTSRAIKVWLSVNTFGLAAFRAAIDRSLDLAQLAQERIGASDELELMTAATLGVVTFRRRFGDDPDEARRAAMNRDLVRALAESGFGLVTSTRLRGRFAIRMVPMNHSTEPHDVVEVLDWLERAEIEAPAAGRAPTQPREREAGVWQTWLSDAPIDAAAIRAVPLFGTLTHEQAEELAGNVERVSVGPGEDILRQWEDSRDLYVILDGLATVTDAGRTLIELGPGDVFGEVAALDWGLDYGYARTATVTAASPVRAIVIPRETLRTLLPAAPQLADELGRLAQERLSRGRPPGPA
jgi:glutamate/tyrosine decarboxylase-like PLP-dependent enzyme